MRRALNLGIVGAGAIASIHADTLLAAGDRISVVLDPSEDRAKALAVRCGGRVAEHLDDLATDLDIDAVVVASSTLTHLSIAESLVEHRIPILLEKPPWVPGQHPSTLLTTDVLVAVGVTTRFRRGLRTLRGAIAAGRLGTIESARDTIAYQLAPGLLAPWYRGPNSQGGGVLLTNGVHSLDRLSWLLGTPLSLDGARFDHFPEGGDKRAELSLTAGDTAVRSNLVWSDDPVVPSTLTVTGTAGSAVIAGDGGLELTSRDGDVAADADDGFAYQWSVFTEAICGGQRSEIPTPQQLEPTMDLIAAAMGAAT